MTFRVKYFKTNLTLSLEGLETCKGSLQEQKSLRPTPQGPGRLRIQEQGRFPLFVSSLDL